MQMLGGRGDGGGRGGDNYDQSYGGQNHFDQSPAPAPRQPAPQQAPANQNYGGGNMGGNNGGFDDDIPF
jgi:hypothetical protein